MVGIVGILLLGSLTWSAVGALIGAVGAAATALSPHAPPPTLAPPVVVATTPSPIAIVTDTPLPALEPTPADTATPLPAVVETPTPAPQRRNPWVLQPLPEPGSRVAPGSITVEARARGDAPIKQIRLELDGAALSVSLEQRSETTWRGSASSRVAAGEHSVRAVVTDASGRSGSFRWTFTVAPGT